MKLNNVPLHRSKFFIKNLITKFIIPKSLKESLKLYAKVN